MEEILRKLCKENVLTSIFMNNDDVSKFTVGYIEQVFEDGIIISVVDTGGRSDGYALLNMSLIYLLEYKNNYLKGIQDLLDYHKNPIIPLSFIHDEDESLIVNFLNFCMVNDLYISIKHLNGFEIFGLIYSVNEEILTLKTYDHNNNIEDGMTALSINDIEGVYVLNTEQKKVQLMQQNR